MKNLPWLSSILLFLAFMGFGAFLHMRHSHDVIWSLAVGYAVLQAALLTYLWKPLRRFLMRGFQSDFGYTSMALVAASLAVVMIVWIQIFAYFLVMLAAALLLRVDLLIRDIGHGLAFVSMLALSLAGLGLSRLITSLILSPMAETQAVISSWTL